MSVKLVMTTTVVKTQSTGSNGGAQGLQLSINVIEALRGYITAR